MLPGLLSGSNNAGCVFTESRSHITAWSQALQSYQWSETRGGTCINPCWDSWFYPAATGRVHSAALSPAQPPGTYSTTHTWAQSSWNAPPPPISNRGTRTELCSVPSITPYHYLVRGCHKPYPPVIEGNDELALLQLHVNLPASQQDQRVHWHHAAVSNEHAAGLNLLVVHQVGALKVPGLQWYNPKDCG